MSRSLELALAEDAIFRRKAQNSFPHFVGYTKPDYEFAWHNILLMKYLQLFADGVIKKLLVFMPPRHGKSELVSRRLPAFMLGRNPNLQIIAASYGMSLASRMNRDVQRIIMDPKYMSIFPNVYLGSGKQNTKNEINYLKNTEIFEIADHRGVYRAAGVGTGITGMGLDVGLLDDPVKDPKSAHSETQREGAWDWFVSTFITRQQKGARLCATMTRWNEDDIAGRIMKKIEENPDDPAWKDWVVLRLPALADEDMHPEDTRAHGEPLWPGFFPVEKIEEYRSILGTNWFNALYQQRPSSEGGNIVKREWWKYYENPPSRFDEVIQSWDFTFKNTAKADFVVGTVWGKKGADKYLLDMFRARLGFVESLKAVEQVTAKWPEAYRKYVEEAANGAAIIDALNNKISGIIPVRPGESKEARAHAISAQVESGNVHLPKNAPFLHDFLSEWAVFPHGKNDDIVDSTTQALSQLESSGIDRLEKLLTY